jgi:hypothetical protein
MARAAQALRQLAHRLPAHEPLEPAGMLDRVLARRQREQIVRIKIKARSLDCTIVRCIPTARGREKIRAAELRHDAKYSSSPVAPGGAAAPPHR